MRKYYYANGQRIAMRQGTSTSITGLRWLLTDHLGSTSIIADATGARISELRYMPWGEPRFASGNTPTDFHFTGQRDQGFGLIDYGARFYSPALGRFTSPDTLVPDPYNPLDWDRFSYTGNNPVNFRDPSGHMRIADGDQGPCKNNCGWVPTSGSTSNTTSPNGPAANSNGAQDSHNGGQSQNTPSSPNLPEHGFVLPQPSGSSSSGAPGGYSDPELEALLLFWDKVGSPFFDLFDAYDMYRFTSKGGYKAFRMAFNTGFIEAGVAGFRQYYRDTWYQSLSPLQRGGRVVIAGVEALATDVLSGLAAGTGATIGLEVGPVGSGIGYFAGNVLITAAGDRFWANFNKNVLPKIGLGAFP